MPEAPYTPLSRTSLVLASASAARRSMLEAAGIAVEVHPSGLDERAAVAAIAGGDDALPPADVAAVLALAKAETVSAARAGAVVLGADQTLDLDGELLVKPGSVDEARRNLLRLRGRTHVLHSAAALVRDGETLWSDTASASLTMRDFTPQFLGRYSVAAGADLVDCVGSYRLEGPGAQLFERVDGDWFTVLGLPLLPLLEALRRHGVLDT